MKPYLSLHSLLACALALGGLLCGNAAQALTLTVPEQYSTIQAALNAAHSGDTIRVGPGLYYGNGNVNLDTLDKAVTLKSAAGPGVTFLDGGQSAQVFNIHSGETAKTLISGFTIQHGAGQNGGGISVQNSSPTLTNCVFQDNAATTNGGGIYVIAGSPTISNCVFYSNTSQGWGGGLYLAGGAARVSACTFESNAADVWGGGVFLEGDTSKVSTCSFDNNTAADGGGIAADLGSRAIMSSCDVTGNTASAAGGGILVYSSKVALTNCEFLSNSAPQGGGAEIDSSTPSLTGCSFTNNTASDTDNGTGGGAILILTSTGSSAPKLTTCLFMSNTGIDGGAILSYGTPTMSRCVFAQNTGTNDGGAFDGLAGSTVIVNCVFLANTAANFNGGALRFSACKATLTNDSFYGDHGFGGGDAIYATGNSTVSVNNSIVWDSANPYGPGSDIHWDGSGSLKFAYTDDFDGVPSGTGNLSADPLYANPDEGDLYLQSGSPCIHTGTIKAPDYSKLDLDGDPRNPTTPSIGAYEG